MLFFRLILKNLLNRKTRTILTTMGISIGIATIVTFGIVSRGLKNNVAAAFQPGNADFTVAKANIVDMILSLVSEEQLEIVRHTEGVQTVIPYVMALARYGGNPFFMLTGIGPESLDALGARIIEGRVQTSDDEITIGRVAARNNHLSVGEEVTIGDHTYSIVGIFESGVTFQDGGAAITVAQAQRLKSIKSDQVSMALVIVKPGYSPRAVADAVESADPSLVTISSVEEYRGIDRTLTMLESASFVISLLAILIGGIGVMNTIIMSVFERTREIGILRALGWKRKRVIAMILGEAALISVASAIAGTLMGLSTIFLIMQTNIGRSWLVLSFDPAILLQVIGVSFAVVVIGAVYPALRASNFSPIEALRYE